MSDLTKIYVVRHGESTFNAIKNIESFKHDGEYGSPLTLKGKKQAKKLAEKLGHVNFSAILSSDLNRTRETAEIVAKEENLTVATDKTIRERSIFEYLDSKDSLKNEGLSALNIELLAALEKLDEKAKMNYKHSPSYESAEEGALRLLKFIIAAEKMYRGKTIMIISHGNIMRSLLTHLGWAKFDELPNSTIENTGYFVLESDGKSFNVAETSGISKQIGQFRNF